MHYSGHLPQCRPLSCRQNRRTFPQPRLLVAALACAFLLPLTAQAQTATPAQSADDILRRQDEREREQRRQQEQTPDVRLPRTGVPAVSEQFPAKETPCFPISRITLAGELAEKFQFGLASVISGGDPAIGRCLGTQGINTVLTRVQNAIVAKGYVTTRVLVAPQDLKSGELVLTVIPGRIRKIRFSDKASPRGTYVNAMPAKAGDILNLRDIEQGLENFKRVPTAEADIQIKPAEGADAAPGESDLVIDYAQATPFRLSLSVDDSGSKATGKYQGNLTFSYDNWWTLNDLFYVSLNHDVGGGSYGAHGTRGSIVHYSIPLGYWLLSATASESRYHQSVAGASQTYIYSGTSENFEVRLSRVLYRDASRKTTGFIQGYLRKSNNFIDDTEVEVQRRRMAGWALGLSHREFLGKSTLDANLTYRQGTGAFEALRAPEEAFGEGTSRPTIITADVAFNVPFEVSNQHLRYSGNWRVQWNRSPVVPQDRFSIGGRYTVRGFDGENTLTAERGWLIRNDIGLALGQSGQELYFGADIGQVGGPTSELLLGKTLAGAVLGLRGGGHGFTYDLFVGTPLSKPDRFQTSSSTAGFNLTWSY